ncbi:response regulator [Roseospira visakhapatnamensis]|uniref:CheY-like chemotaxis protein n=1 Tax=Roseospira visakhapatnamensis TaxID=390880 RepID=A0A7W6RDT6_9PROT|nr:response regulator [Roseospira visakhapatnamensis]MBB4266695.1 CheY-like chemotaxis protein [Roseospira visakhapatnamensis]
MSLDLSQFCILVVDDNPHMRRIVKEILRALGVGTIKDATDGADALKIMRVITPDVIIADLDMSPLDGLEFTRMVRTGKDSTNRYVPIIMLTAHSESFRVVQARDAGVTEFLAKPISVKRLSLRLEAVIKRPRVYVRTRTFFGPDRRRRTADPQRLPHGERRRGGPPPDDTTGSS